MFRLESLPRLYKSVAFVASAAILATGALMARPAVAEDMNLRLGYQFTLWGLPAVVALELGLYEKHGLTVDARRFGAGRDAMEGIIGGSLDVSTTGSTPFLVGAARGAVQAIAASGYMGATGCLMAGKDTGIKEVADFKGKRIASRRGTTIDLAVIDKILPPAGLSRADVTMVNVNFPDMVAALAAGSVEGFAGVEPSCAIAEHQGIAVTIERATDYDMLANTYIAATGWAEKNPQKTEAFLRAAKESADIIQNQPDKVLAIVGELYKDYNLDDDVLRAVIATVDADIRYRDGLQEYLAENLASMHAAGDLPVGELDWDKVLYRGGLQKIGLDEGS